MKSCIENEDFYTAITDTISNELKTHGLPESKAIKTALKVETVIQKTFAGQSIYIKTNRKNQNQETILAMLDEYQNGSTTVQLARKYGVSLQCCYDRLKKARKLANRSGQ